MKRALGRGTPFVDRTLAQSRSLSFFTPQPPEVVVPQDQEAIEEMLDDLLREETWEGDLEDLMETSEQQPLQQTPTASSTDSSG